MHRGGHVGEGGEGGHVLARAPCGRAPGERREMIFFSLVGESFGNGRSDIDGVDLFGASPACDEIDDTTG